MCEQNSEDLPPPEFSSESSSDAKLPLPSIELFRKAVAQHSMAETRFGIVDVQTANLVVQCYEKGSDLAKGVIEQELSKSAGNARRLYQRCWSLVGA